MQTLRYWKSAFWSWTGSYYRALDESELSAELAEFLHKEVKLVSTTSNGTEILRPATGWHISNTLKMLPGVIRLPADLSPPLFLDAGGPGGQLIAVKNGVLDLSTATLYPASPAFFNLDAIDAGYDPDATCPNWLEFLGQVWPNDPESIACLQDIFGYLLESKNDLQKAFLVKGPKRSGKGTIGRMAARLKGNGAAKPALKDLTDTFGLEQLIDKSLAIVADARLDRKNPNLVLAVERILSISGGDRPSVQRKYKSAYDLGLNTVFLMLMNELPLLPDTSGALANRFIPLCIFVSFFGREDPTLFEQKLEPEVSGVLNWAIEGRWRLRERGHFIVPDSASGLLESFEELSNPLSQYFAHRAYVIPPSEYPAGPFDSPDKGFLLDKAVFYDDYVAWCKGHELRPKNRDWFYRDVSAMGIDSDFRWDPEKHTSRTAEGKKAQRWVRGVKLK